MKLEVELSKIAKVYTDNHLIEVRCRYDLILSKLQSDAIGRSATTTDEEMMQQAITRTMTYYKSTHHANSKTFFRG